jgi:hypothetical protein
MTAQAEAQSYVLSRIDYDEEVGYYPAALISVDQGSYRSSIRFHGTLEKATTQAESILDYKCKELGVFSWDAENEKWDIVVIVSLTNGD